MGLRDLFCGGKPKLGLNEAKRIISAVKRSGEELDSNQFAAVSATAEVLGVENTVREEANAVEYEEMSESEACKRCAEETIMYASDQAAQLRQKAELLEQEAAGEARMLRSQAGHATRKARRATEIRKLFAPEVDDK